MQNFGRQGNKKRRTSFYYLFAVCTGIQLYGSSKPHTKGKMRFFIFKYAS